MSVPLSEWLSVIVPTGAALAMKLISPTFRVSLIVPTELAPQTAIPDIRRCGGLAERDGLYIVVLAKDDGDVGGIDDGGDTIAVDGNMRVAEAPLAQQHRCGVKLV